MSIAAKARARAAAAFPVDPTLPANLRRNAPLVPTDTAAGRSLAAVIAILTFLAGLCAGAAEMVAANAGQWQTSVAQEVTIQVRPGPGRDVDADVAKAQAIAKDEPGIAQTRIFSKAESERLLEPWLGTGWISPTCRCRASSPSGCRGSAPISAGCAPGSRTPCPASRAWTTTPLWLQRLSTAANAFVGAGVGLVVLVLVATGLAVTFATRGAMAGNKEVVEVLHFVGAGDDYIARAFQARFFGLGLRGGGIGAACAILAFIVAGLITGSASSGPAGQELEALFGAFQIGWRGYLSIALIGGIASLVTGAVSRITVRRYLS